MATGAGGVNRPDGAYDWALLYAIGFATALVIAAWLRSRR